jgi:bacteriorhodopsin
MLLGLGSSGKKWLAQLVALDVVMIVTAYIAEVSPLASGTWWSFFLIACAAELAIVWILFAGMKDAIAKAEAPIAKALRGMRGFILFGWLIYPIGFLLALAGPDGGSIREISYNIADVINKVGFGLVAYYGVKTMSSVASSGKEVTTES